MTIYLDSAQVADARQARELGWIGGVTTNPTLLKAAGAPPDEVLRALAGLGFAQVFYQLTAPDLQGMRREAERARDIVGDGLVLKLPPTELGLRYVAASGPEQPCCVTAVFASAQALAARAAGARYVAVYVNRATRLLGDGPTLVEEVSTVLAGSQTEVLAASLKSSDECVAAARSGAPHLTAPLAVLRSLLEHPVSQETLSAFARDGAGLPSGS